MELTNWSFIFLKFFLINEYVLDNGYKAILTLTVSWVCVFVLHLNKYEMKCFRYLQQQMPDNISKER